ncbi:glycosyl transferase [Polynucleobacter tropicus]|uniref:Glycosyl transferase n=1 Tax=Polynucleobacter tropicus TaxID=1743174 RepID=A0A6M9PYJ9_9BURK|nr:glycosyltransferase family 2 protein [Polynucleobacter tropicus]QKM64057.1 glycosyl transferase [Polynucleobacter tropicus]
MSSGATPKISIVTAIYNREKSVKSLCNSFSTQTYSNKEHIIVDGGSNDGTLRLLEEYSHKFGCYLISEPDEGIYDAINKGVRLATGEIIGLLHSDDLFANPNILELVAKEFLDPTLDAIYGDAVFFDAKNSSKFIRKYSSRRFSLKSIAWGWIPAHTTLFVRRRVFEKHGMYKTNYKIAGDVEFISRIFTSEGFRSKYIPVILVRMGIGGISTAGLKNTILLNIEMMRALKESGVKTNFFKILSRYPLKMLEFFNFK